MTLEFWFEFASTYSYPAAMRMEEAARRADVEVTWRAFMLAPVFKAQGWTDTPFNVFPARARYMWRDVERVCADLGIPFRKPTQFPRNGLLAARVSCEFAASPWLPAFVRAIYLANFEHDVDIGQRSVVADCLREVGADPEPVLARAESEPSKLALRAQTERAVGLGIFGAPTFIVDGELFWGNDRLEQALRWAAARKSQAVGA